jgi:CRISPR-associated protein Csb2
MAPVLDAWRDILMFPIRSTVEVAVSDGQALVRAARRALMARARDLDGAPGRLFSGHEEKIDAPARSGHHEHVFLTVDDSDGDGRIDRIIAAAPWTCDFTAERRTEDRARFDRVVSQLEEIRAGALGVIRLGRPMIPAEGDPLIGPACVWDSRSIYHPTRHASRREDMATAVIQDLGRECARRGLPRPNVEILKCAAGPNGGHITAHVRLTFSVAVRGPLLLGKDSHRGSGLFAVAEQ